MTQTLADQQPASPDFEVADEEEAAALKIETVSSRRGRKAFMGNGARGGVSAEIVETARAAAPAIAALRANSVSMAKSELAQSLSLAQGFGMFQAFDLMAQFSGLARLKWLSERKQSEDYKGITVIDRQGQSRTLNTFEDLCSYMGSSYRKIAEDLQNLAQFGESFMSTAEALGLGYRDLRLLRRGIAQLPPDERRAILEEVRNAEGPEELKDKLAELRTELAEAKAKTHELSATLKAKEEVSKKKSDRLEELETRLERLDSMLPDDRQKALNEINAKARADLDKVCQDVFVAVMGLCSQCAEIFRDERSSDDTCAYLHERVGLLMNNVADAVITTGINVDLRQYIELPGEDELASERVSGGEASAESETVEPD